jgi:hypothetical protein
MASTSNHQPSSPSTPVVNTTHFESSQNPNKIKHRNILKRMFGKLHASPFIYTDELKQYSINGGTVITKK